MNNEMLRSNRLEWNLKITSSATGNRHTGMMLGEHKTFLPLQNAQQRETIEIFGLCMVTSGFSSHEFTFVCLQMPPQL